MISIVEWTDTNTMTHIQSPKKAVLLSEAPWNCLIKVYMKVSGPKTISVTVKESVFGEMEQFTKATGLRIYLTVTAA